MRGRPLRFLGLVGSVWVGGRVAMLWPAVEAVSAYVSPPRVARAFAAVPQAAAVPGAATRIVRSSEAARSKLQLAGAADPRGSRGKLDADILASVGMFYFTEVPAGTVPATLPRVTAPVADLPLWTPLPVRPERKRWSLDAWTLLRPESRSAAFGPQLGGSQAGVRLAYRASRTLSAFVRAATPLDTGGVELAAGAQWQPTKLPVAAFAEARRRPGGKIVPVAGLVGGVYRAPIASGWRLDGYGQAGAIGGRTVEGVADGQARATRSVGRAGPAAFDAGLGAWGGVQRDAARLDLGPTLGVELPVRTGNLRLTLDWRQRVAGRAAPSSGPALTLAAGF